MELTRLKRLLALTGTLAALAGIAALLIGAALLVVQTGTGAAPGDAFNPTEMIPESLQGKVAWSPDEPGLDRSMEPSTRAALEAAWLDAAASRELAATTSITAESHALRVDFYSLDGQIARIAGTSRVETTIGAASAKMLETYEAILVLTDGRWEIDQLVRADAILIES